MKPPPPPSKRNAPPASQRAFTPTEQVREGNTGVVSPPSSRAPISARAPVSSQSSQRVASVELAGPASQTGRRQASMVGKLLDGRFLIDGLLGEGGMGYVYAGLDQVDQCRVAIKILRSDFLHDNEIVQRFLNEAQAASSIGSPHICSVFGIGQTPSGAAYYVMEFLDGKNLADVINEERLLPVRRILRIGSQIARGLHAAHSNGIVHRDLKPDNVMLVPRADADGITEFVKILDFGVAKVAGARSKLTRAGSVFGTPHYMSPEQASGSASIDGRADIYSLGIILYELAAGNVPFDDENMMNVLSHQMFREAPALRDVAPQVIPDDLAAIVRACLQKSPEHRFVSMEAVAQALDRVLATLPAGQFETVIPSSKRPVTDTNPRATSATVRELPRPKRSNVKGVLWAIGLMLGVVSVFGASRWLKRGGGDVLLANPRPNDDGEVVIAAEPPTLSVPPQVSVVASAPPLLTASAMSSLAASTPEPPTKVSKANVKATSKPPAAAASSDAPVKPTANPNCSRTNRNFNPFSNDCN